LSSMVIQYSHLFIFL